MKSDFGAHCIPQWFQVYLCLNWWIQFFHLGLLVHHFIFCVYEFTKACNEQKREKFQPKMDSFFCVRCSFSIFSAGVVVFIGDSTQICTNIIAIIHIFFLYKMLVVVVFFCWCQFIFRLFWTLKISWAENALRYVCVRNALHVLRICENRIWAFFYILISVYLVFIIQVKLNWLLLSVVPCHAISYSYHCMRFRAV